MADARRLLVCDLDNTLYDWVGYFVPSFYAMVDAVVEITHCDRDGLLNDFREVHQRLGNSEEPFALLETRTIRAHFAGQSNAKILKDLDPALHAFNSARKQNLKVHPGVHETLDALVASGVHVVAHTDSKLFGVVDRLGRLDLFRHFRKVYCSERSALVHPAGLLGTRAWLDQFPMEKVVELSHHRMKPDPDVLLEICNSERVSPAEAAYVGDSVAKDVLMAKRAGVYSIWAAYGARHDSKVYEGLVRISHWTKAEIERERVLAEQAQSIRPDYIARECFGEVLAAIEYVPPAPGLLAG